MSDAEALDRTGERPRLKEPARYRGSLAVWCLLIAYASLYPFLPPRLPGGDALAGFFARPKYITEFDVALNVIAYVPLGTLACLHFLQEGRRTRAIVTATLLGAALSFAMESAQLFIPTRIASIYDVLSNTAGALAGALVFLDPWYSTVTRPLGELRERVVIEGQWGDAGLMLVILWLIAQLNPALPFFGAGNIVSGDGAGTVAPVLQWAGVALSICGFGLFISSSRCACCRARRASTSRSSSFSRGPCCRRSSAPTTRSTSGCGSSAGPTGSSRISPRSRSTCTRRGLSSRSRSSSRCSSTSGACDNLPC